MQRSPGNLFDNSPVPDRTDGAMGYAAFDNGDLGNQYKDSDSFYENTVSAKSISFTFDNHGQQLYRTPGSATRIAK